jgi:transport and Golgi organization protein 2
MCTVSWRHNDEGYELLCNRDELHTRKPARPPCIKTRSGVQFVAPIDGDHGGSWIAVNEFGLTFCLLNNSDHSRYQTRRPATSRGLFLMELVDSSSLDAANRRLTQLRLESFRPFDLAVLQPHKSCLLVHWTGLDLVIEQDGENAMPLLSSSFDQVGVAKHRRRIFHNLLTREGKITSALLDEFHRSHAPAASAYSPCMHRQDACTVSFSRVRVIRECLEFYYLGASPCTCQASPHRVRLPLVQLDSATMRSRQQPIQGSEQAQVHPSL